MLLLKHERLQRIAATNAKAYGPKVMLFSDITDIFKVLAVIQCCPGMASRINPLVIMAVEYALQPKLKKWSIVFNR